MQKKILIVDDEPALRELLVNFLSMEGHLVKSAESGIAALAILEKEFFDLVLSDVRMPGMTGFEFLKQVKSKYPSTKRVLITTYDVEDYMELLFEQDQGNVLTKGVPFNFEEIRLVINNLLSERIFGLSHYLNSATKIECLKIASLENAEESVKKVAVCLEVMESPRLMKLKIVLGEILTNALMYGNNSSPDASLTMTKEITPILLSYGKDSEKYAVSVEDAGGRLKKSTVLYWLNRQLSKDAAGLPRGLYDTHGRGIFITREYADRLIINIQKNIKTEVIVINYFNPQYQNHKPLSIYEV